MDGISKKYLKLKNMIRKLKTISQELRNKITPGFQFIQHLSYQDVGFVQGNISLIMYLVEGYTTVRDCRIWNYNREEYLQFWPSNVTSDTLIILFPQFKEIVRHEKLSIDKSFKGRYHFSTLLFLYE